MIDYPTLSTGQALNSVSFLYQFVRAIFSIYIAKCYILGNFGICIYILNIGLYLDKISIFSGQCSFGYILGNDPFYSPSPSSPVYIFTLDCPRKMVRDHTNKTIIHLDYTICICLNCEIYLTKFQIVFPSTAY